MGFSHYFEVLKTLRLSRKAKKAILDDVDVYLEFVQAQKGIKLEGITDPDHTCIYFDGSTTPTKDNPRGLSCETMYFDFTKGWKSCKTNRLPYDGAVTGVLLILLATLGRSP